MVVRELYKAYQKKRVEQVDDDRLKFEISTMLSREVIQFDHQVVVWVRLFVCTGHLSVVR